MSALAKGPLTVAETEFLAQCEETISAGLMTWVEVAQALTSIRDNRLYRIDHATFEDYCAKRWHISRPRAYELMGAAAVVSAIADTGAEPPTNEAQARELRRVPEEQREAVWQKALETTEGKPTAAAVRAAAEEVATPDQPDDRPAEATVPVSVAGVDGAVSPAAPSAPLPTAIVCEVCAAELPDDQAECGYMRCDECDSEGEHTATTFPNAGGPCAVCSAASAAEPAAPSVADVLASDPAIQTHNYAVAFAKALSRSGALIEFEAERVAESVNPETFYALEVHAAAVTRLFEAVRKARFGGPRLVVPGESA